MFRDESHFAIYCDGCGAVWDEPPPKATEPVRPKAARHGWQVVGDLDYCPACATNENGGH